MEKNYDNAYLEYLAELVLPVKKRSYSFIPGVAGQATVIDLGCGTGIDCRNICREVSGIGTMIGIDHDPVALEEAIANSDGSIRYILAEGTALPVEDHSADIVRCERVFQHLEFPEAVMKELHRVLKPGGKAIILETDWMTMSFGTPMVAAERKLADEMIYKNVRNGLASRTIGDQLAKTGFSVEAIEVWPTTVRSLKDASYVMGLERNTERAGSENEVFREFIALLNRNDAENRLMFTWNTYLYVGRKE